MRHLIKIVCVLVIFALSLCGCIDQQCVDADDYGFSVVKIPAGFKSTNIYGSGSNQYVKWTDSHLTLNGDNIHFVVSPWRSDISPNSSTDVSAWCPWYNFSATKNLINPICIRFPKCEFPNGYCSTSSTDSDFISNAPCVISGGIGLYALLMKTQNGSPVSPNDNSTSINNPITYKNGVEFWKHVGDTFGNYYGILQNGNYETTSGLYYDYDVAMADRTSYIGSKLYFKVLDSYYGDNSGQYILVLKSGFENKSTNIFDTVIQSVKNIFFGTSTTTGVVQSMFQKITQNQAYANFVRLLLTVYLTTVMLSFLIGLTPFTQAVVLGHLFKILIIVQVLSADSWNFFYNNLFTLFVNGLDELSALIKASATSGPGASDTLSFLFAQKLWIKLISLWYGDNGGIGFVYTILFFIVAITVFLISVRIAKSYLMSMIMISILIILFPLFICFILFDFTRGLFDTWIQKISAYTLHPLIAIVAVTMVGGIIKDQMYQITGFKVCKTSSVVSAQKDPAGATGSQSFFYWWKPITVKLNALKNSDGTINQDGESKKQVYIPLMHYRDASGNITSDSTKAVQTCLPYQCQGERYPSFPFLDPSNENSLDYKILQDFSNGKFQTWNGLWLILLCAFMLWHFYDIAGNISEFISGGIGVSASASFRETAGDVSLIGGAKGAMASMANMQQNFALAKAGREATLEKKASNIDTNINNANHNKDNNENKDNGNVTQDTKENIDKDGENTNNSTKEIIDDNKNAPVENENAEKNEKNDEKDAQNKDNEAIGDDNANKDIENKNDNPDLNNDEANNDNKKDVNDVAENNNNDNQDIKENNDQGNNNAENKDNPKA